MMSVNTETWEFSITQLAPGDRSPQNQQGCAAALTHQIKKHFLSRGQVPETVEFVA